MALRARTLRAKTLKLIHVIKFCGRDKCEFFEKCENVEIRRQSVLHALFREMYDDAKDT